MAEKRYTVVFDAKDMASSRLSAMEQQAKKTSRGMDELASKTKTVSAATTQLDGTYRDANGRLRDANGKFIKMSDAVKKANDEMGRLSGSYRDANGRLRDANGKFLKVTDAVKGTNTEVHRSGGLLSRMGSEFSRIGRTPVRTSVA